MTNDSKLQKSRFWQIVVLTEDSKLNVYRKVGNLQHTSQESKIDFPKDIRWQDSSRNFKFVKTEKEYEIIDRKGRRLHTKSSAIKTEIKTFKEEASSTKNTLLNRYSKNKKKSPHNEIKIYSKKGAYYDDSFYLLETFNIDEY